MSERFLPDDASIHESEMLRQFFLQRQAEGVDLRALMLGACAQLGQLASSCTQTGYLEPMLEAMDRTIRYNALLAGPEHGHG
jgi:hypothetical protein